MPPASFSRRSEAQRTEAYASSLAAALLDSILNSLGLCRDRPRLPAPYISASHEWIFSTLLE